MTSIVKNKRNFLVVLLQILTKTPRRLLITNFRRILRSAIMCA